MLLASTLQYDTTRESSRFLLFSQLEVCLLLTSLFQLNLGEEKLIIPVFIVLWGLGDELMEWIEFGLRGSFLRDAVLAS